MMAGIVDQHVDARRNAASVASNMPPHRVRIADIGLGGERPGRPLPSIFSGQRLGPVLASPE